MFKMNQEIYTKAFSLGYGETTPRCPNYSNVDDRLSWLHGYLSGGNKFNNDFNAKVK